jgi:hypothetical protein
MDDVWRSQHEQDCNRFWPYLSWSTWSESLWSEQVLFVFFLPIWCIVSIFELTWKIFYIWDQGARIGLYFINRPEWIIVDHACAAYSYVSVPLYDTLGMFTTQNDHRLTVHSWFIWWHFFFVNCTCRSWCCPIHCEPCNCGSYILCASNSKHCEL